MYAARRGPVGARVTARRSPLRNATIWCRIGLIAAAAVLVAEDHRQIGTALAAATGRIFSASSGWLLAAAALAVASMVAFGVLRQRTVRAAGGRLPLREAVAISYGAGAIHLSAPGGVVLSTAYVFRKLQRRGVPAATIAWSALTSGVLSSVTLIALGAAGFALGRPVGSWTTFAPIGASAVGVVALAWTVTRRPDRVTRAAARVLRLGNRVVRRPAESGVGALQRAVADFRAIQATPSDWFVAFLAAAANWALDLMCLWACAQAFGVHVQPWVLLTSYALAMAGAGLSPLPGGVGIVESVLVLALAASAAAPVTIAVGAVLVYRVISLGSLLVGGSAYIGVGSLRSWARTRVLRASP